MVFIMKNNNHIFTILTVTISFTVLTTTNVLSSISSQDLVYATNEQHEDASFENGDGPFQGSDESNIPQGSTESEQTEESNKKGSSNGNGNDLSTSSQNNECPDTIDLSDVPTFIGEDGCQYPCPTYDNSGQGNVPQGCPIEASPQTTPSLSINEERPIQPLQQQPQQQQNTPPNPNQNTLINPRINSDTAGDISTTKETMTTQKSFNPAGKYKPGSGQTELTIPGKLDGMARPYTPGGGNTQVEGIPVQPNTNPQTPFNPGDVPTNIPAKGYATVITKVLGFFNGIQASNFEVCVDSTVITDGKERNTDASPPCAYGSGLGAKYTVQAPGNIGISVKNLRPVSYMVEHPLSMDIAAYESKTFTIFISPYPSQ
jgi:hypothetical protein